MAKDSKGKVKKLRGQNEPKKPTTEYFMFLRDERQNLTKGLTVREQTDQLSRKWALLLPEKKKEYSMEYAQALAKYKEEMAAYKATPEYEELMKTNNAAKKEMNAKEKGKSAKVTRKPSGYNLFVKEERARMMQTRKEDEAVPQFVEISKAISAKWKGLSEEEKEAYREKARIAGLGSESIDENQGPIIA
ncbi:hypothetical protein NEDG_01032 [Nematocida displodere]|uniref:HMG box domain-containing protein n=1 Tax=Nematocida displodere TaxID=1805483 RepID=A0A177EAD5_9MICR|nr:hypothetical protein NEDG_01032 [Nematocida displodere]